MRSEIIDYTTGDCVFMETGGDGTNLATNCVFISKRVLKISVNALSVNLFTLKIQNLKSPSFLPEGKYNQYRFTVFCSSDSAENDISHYSFIDFSN